MFTDIEDKSQTEMEIPLCISFDYFSSFSLHFFAWNEESVIYLIPLFTSMPLCCRGIPLFKRHDDCCSCLLSLFLLLLLLLLLLFSLDWFGFSSAFHAWRLHTLQWKWLCLYVEQIARSACGNCMLKSYAQSQIYIVFLWVIHSGFRSFFSICRFYAIVLDQRRCSFIITRKCFGTFFFFVVIA